MASSLMRGYRLNPVIILTVILISMTWGQASAQSLPAGWSQHDVGAVGVAGSASQSNGVFTVSGAGPTIWGTADGFHFVYQPMAGDGYMVARVLSVTGIRSGSNTNPAVGVMIRETLNANSTHASSVYRLGPMIEHLHRSGTGSNTAYTNSGSTPLPYWVKVVRSGTSFTSFIAPDGMSWTQVGASVTISMATNVYIGLAVTTEDSCNCSLVTATFDNVSVSATPWVAPPSAWLDQDVGTTGVPGNVGYSNGVFTVSGAGPTIWGTADGFHFVYQPISGDGTIVARVLGVTGIRSGSNTNPAVGVMIRESLSASSGHASSVYRLGPMVEQLWRTTYGGSTQYVNSGAILLPYWVKVIRSGSSFSSYISPDGVSWTQVGSTQTISMVTNAYIGLAVTTEDSCNCSLVTATFDNVSVTSSSVSPPVISSIWPPTGIAGFDVLISGSGFGTSQGNSQVLLNGTPMTVNSWNSTSISATVPSGATSGPLTVLVGPSMNSSNPVAFKVLPDPMLDQDVGTVAAHGNASYADGVFTVSGAGANIYGTADGMHFAYQPLSGDGTIVARVVSITGMQNGTAKAGVMIRETLNANSTHASAVFLTGNPLVNFLWRPTTGASTSFANCTPQPLPYWLKVVRSGNTFSAYCSANGTAWAQVGSNQTFSMATNAYIGLAVDSGSTSDYLVTATFDNVSITPVTAQPPVIGDINPFSGPVGSSVTISGANFGPQGTSTVTFNGISAGPGVWTPTAITVPVPYGATSGNIVVKANGINSNGVPFTVIPAPTITSLIPPSGPVGTPVTITGTNFGSSKGSSTVAFAGITASTVTTWSPTSIGVNVPNSAVTGGVVVTVAGLPSNIVGFTVTSTSPTITNLTPASGPVGTSVTINGANFGTTTGYVTFNGSYASTPTWNASTIVATVPSGATSGPVIVITNAGPASNPANFTVYTAQSATLTVNPKKINMVVGQTQAIQLLDQNGVPFSSPTWSVANPSIASVVQGAPTLLQATALGNTTLTGTSPDGRTGSSQVTILAGTSLPAGTVQWEVPSLGTTGAGITNIVQAPPTSDPAPAFYVLDSGANGGSGAFRALTADGQQKWMFTPSAPSNEELTIVAADDQGGFIYQRDDWSDQNMLGRVDETGNQSWLIPTPHMAVPGMFSNVAIHPDGTVYFVEGDYLNTGNSPTAAVALDELSGQMRFAVPLPNGTYTGFDYSYLDGPNGPQYCTPGTSTASVLPASTFGHLTISSDGIVYLPVLTGTSSFDAMPCDASPDPNHPGYPHVVKSTDGVYTASNSLQVMAVHSDGTYSTRQLDFTSSGLSQYSILGGATPDGNGGTLLAVNNSGTSSSSPSTFYHDTGSAVTKLNLPINPAGEILLSDGGTAFLAGLTQGSSVPATVAINTANNSVDWTYSSTGGNLSLVATTSGGGVAINNSQLGFMQLGSSGNASSITTGYTASQTSRSWTGDWFALTSLGSGLSKILLPIAVDPASSWALPGGNPSATEEEGAHCDCLVEESDPSQPPPPTCTICNLPPPSPPATSCATFTGAQSKFVLLVGDPGVNDPVSGHTHNVLDLFNLSAQTEANALQTQGHNVIACRVSSIQDVKNALTQNGLIDGGVIYFGHSGNRGFYSSSGALIAESSEIFVGQNAGNDTNIAQYNVSYLANVQNFLGSNTAITISGCDAGRTIYDYYAQNMTSIAQLLSTTLNRGVYAYDVGLYFSQNDTQHDQHVNGMYDPHGKILPHALPMYMVPEGVPGHKPGPKPFCPTGKC